jgi:predicted Rdx family selenoprotein
VNPTSSIKMQLNNVVRPLIVPPIAFLPVQSNSWLLCLKYVCYLLNHTYNDNISVVLLNQLTGTIVSISVLLRFHFRYKVYYKQIEPGFPSESVEACYHIVGIS